VARSRTECRFAYRAADERDESEHDAALEAAMKEV
jgi:hypothetical protein